MKIWKQTLLASAFAMTGSLSVMASETHVVHANMMDFDPVVVKINPGDSVQWTNMSTHNVEMMEGLIPEGQEAFTSPMSENFSHTFEQEGIYIYQCTPHIGAGMGGAVIVGEPTNLQVIKDAGVRGGLGRVVRQVIAAAEEM